MTGKKWLIKFFSCIFIFLFVYTLCMADIYVFKDKNGVLHFTNIPHHKYRLFLKEFEENRHISDTLIKKIAKKYNLPPALIKAIIKVESNFDSNAISEKGAIGLMQLMPETIKDLNVYDPFSPEENIEAGARLLRKLLLQYKGNLYQALGAYFAGPNSLKRNGFTPKVKMYIERVLFYYEYYRQYF